MDLSFGVILSNLNWLKKKKHLTSTDNRKESQNPSVTKINSVVFNNSLDFCAKNRVKRSSHCRDLLCKGIKQSDWQREFWGQNSEPDC